MLAVYKLTVSVRRRTPVGDAVQSVECVPGRAWRRWCWWRITWLLWDKLPIDVNGWRAAERLGRVSTYCSWEELSAEWRSVSGDDIARWTTNTICLSESLYACSHILLQYLCSRNVNIIFNIIIIIIIKQEDVAPWWPTQHASLAAISRLCSSAGNS